MPRDLVGQFEAQWTTSGDVPDVFAFLDQHAPVEPSETLAIVLTDQRRRWWTDSPILVEEYLDRLPGLAAQREYRLQLAESEFRMRQQADHPQDLPEFAARFPEVARQLRERLSRPLREASDTAPPWCAKTISYDPVKTEPIQNVGRYRVIRLLGEGSFGCVYLGFDGELQRPVAIKVPNAQRLRGPRDAEAFLAEARTVARLDHPNIVPVHDVGRTDEGSVYVVSKFIEGVTLGDRIREGHIPPDEAAAILSRVAQALDHAHAQGVIHRDIKPGNVLIETQTGVPYVADFGLAIRDDTFIADGKVVGTPAYMSPEQARGEGHRLDGRSDIFAMGAVLYLMLSGRRPFLGSTVNELLHQVVAVDPPPPRSLDGKVPPELERICLKALSKRISDRYATAAELADDLLNWRGQPEPQSRSLPIVPRGLRSFDASDAGFFLELLPGPRDRNGLPASIQFWKTRLEETDPDATFAVGLCYGPSGCGKSSLMKAGLLPRLDGNVRAVYVEATPAETETRLLRGIRKLFPDLPQDLGLARAFSFLRHDGTAKAVIVIDQFEQWLHATRPDPQAELVAALRQCDGGSLQAVVMVRDDFAMAAARFMDELDIPIVQGRNFATIDLFDEAHAIEVLTRFGQAFGQLPPRRDDFTQPQHEFLATVVSGLAREGSVVPVQLALFAEMIKSKPWTRTTLRQVGGTEGIGVNFLEETFSARSANPKHVQHEQAARQVLKALLPDVGSDIKGNMRSRGELLDASGYRDQPRQFNELLRMLDGELRLITPTDPEGFRSDSGEAADLKHYQLTHDYLVPSLRDWLTRKQTETRRGRMEICLVERTHLWSARREQKQLPSFIEWQGIQRHTRRATWSKSGAAMMRAATRLYLGRLLAGIAFVVVAGAGLVSLRHFIRDREKATRIAHLVNDLFQVRVEHLPNTLAALEPDRDRWTDRVRSVAGAAQTPAPARTRAYLALAASDGDCVVPLVDRLLDCEAQEHAIVRQGLERWRREATHEAWSRAQGQALSSEQLIRAAALLAQFEPEARQWPVFAPAVVDALVGSDPLFVRPWVDDLSPVRAHLLPRLKGVCLDGKASAAQRLLAVGIVAQFVRGDRDFPAADLVELALLTEPAARGALEPLLAQRTDEVLPLLEREIARGLPLAPLAEAQQAVARQSAAIELALRLGSESAFWQHLDDQADPRLRTALINDFSRAALGWKDLRQRLAGAPPRTRQAIVLGLPARMTAFSERELDEARETLLELFRSDPDAGVHSAAWHVLRTTGAEDRATAVRDQLAREQAHQGNWSLLANGLCLVALPPEDPGGADPSPASPPGGPFEISQTEITVNQFRQFQSAYQPAEVVTVSPECPANRVDLFECMRYCRWLSEKEPDFDSKNCCYPPIDQIGPGIQLPADYRRRPGFRLPTVAEWEFAARAGTRTERFFGDFPGHLSRYCWWVETSDERLWPVGLKRPNPWGLFDIYGNVYEWCHEHDLAFDPAGGPTRGGDYRSTQRFLNSSFATWSVANAALSTTGFRVVRIKARP